MPPKLPLSALKMVNKAKNIPKTDYASKIFKTQREEPSKKINNKVVKYIEDLKNFFEDSQKKLGKENRLSLMIPDIINSLNKLKESNPKDFKSRKKLTKEMSEILKNMRSIKSKGDN